MIDNQPEFYYQQMQRSQRELFALVRWMRKHNTQWFHTVTLGTRTPAMVSRRKKTI